MKRPISLNSLRFSDKDGRHVLTEGFDIVLTNREDLEIIIQAKYKYYSELFNRDLMIAEHTNETLTELQIKEVVSITSRLMGISESDVYLKYGNQDIVTVKRFAINICYGRGVKKSQLTKAFNYIHHQSINDHIKNHNNLISTENEYGKLFVKIEEQVLKELDNEYESDCNKDNLNNNEKDKIAKAGMGAGE